MTGLPQDSTPSRASVREAYDLATDAYARKFLHELDHKPLDREWLAEFASLAGRERPVLDLGCGPGHTTAYLTSLSLTVTGVDLSPRMIAKARECFPHARFAEGDFLALPYEPSSIAGIVALYCIVHLTLDELRAGLAEVFRVLSGGGVLLLSFHAGTGVIRAEKFLDTDAVLEFRFFEPAEVKAALTAAGFDRIDVRIREPYPAEYPSQRCYVFAHKPHPSNP
jgi:SAM-dependent methyltransferase